MNFIPLPSWSITLASRFVLDTVTLKTEKKRKSIWYNNTVFYLVVELHTLIDRRNDLVLHFATIKKIISASQGRWNTADFNTFFKNISRNHGHGDIMSHTVVMPWLNCSVLNYGTNPTALLLLHSNSEH